MTTKGSAIHRFPRVEKTCRECGRRFLGKKASPDGTGICDEDACVDADRKKQQQRRLERRRQAAKGQGT